MGGPTGTSRTPAHTISCQRPLLELELIPHTFLFSALNASLSSPFLPCQGALAPGLPHQAECRPLPSPTCRQAHPRPPSRQGEAQRQAGLPCGDHTAQWGRGKPRTLQPTPPPSGTLAAHRGGSLSLTSNIPVPIWPCWPDCPWALAWTLCCLLQVCDCDLKAVKQRK